MENGSIGLSEVGVPEAARVFLKMRKTRCVDGQRSKWWRARKTLRRSPAELTWVISQHAVHRKMHYCVHRRRCFYRQSGWFTEAGNSFNVGDSSQSGPSEKLYNLSAVPTISIKMALLLQVALCSQTKRCCKELTRNKVSQRRLFAEDLDVEHSLERFLKDFRWFIRRHSSVVKSAALKKFSNP